MRGWAEILSAAALTAAVVLLPASPAHAADELDVSDDGASWGAQLSGPLFDGLTLVPRGSANSEFWIRNASSDRAFVRIVLQDVSFSGPVIGDALQITITSEGVSSGPTALSFAAPCHVVFEGELGAGEADRLVARLALGDLPGTEGQGQSAQFRVGIQLSGSVLGNLRPTDCGSPSTVIEITPFDSRVATIASVGVAPNTWRLFEEYALLVVLAALIVGVGGRLLLAAWMRRRRERDDEQRQYLEDLA